VVLHLLTKRRQDLVAARTQTINRLHRLLMDLVPGGASRNLTANRAAALLAAVTPLVRRRSRAGSWPPNSSPTPAQLEQRIAAVEARIKTAVAQSNTTLVRLLGWGRCWRPRSWAGSAISAGSPPSIISPPIPAPPVRGLQRPGRASPAVMGRDRKLNHALYMMAMVQVGRPSAGRAYYQRKLAEGKSAKEALRCLKRRLSDAVYRCLLEDQHHHQRTRGSPTHPVL
jgi:transposase